MTTQEKRTIVSIINAVLIFGSYFVYVFLKYKSGGLDLENDLSFWGKTMLIFVPIGIVVRIILEILFNIVIAIGTSIKEGRCDENNYEIDEDPSFEDERDKLYSLKAGRAGQYVVGAGFMVSMATLAFGQAPWIMFNIIFLSFSVSEIVESLVQLYLYRRGY